MEGREGRKKREGVCLPPSGAGGRGQSKAWERPESWTREELEGAKIIIRIMTLATPRNQSNCLCTAALGITDLFIVPQVFPGHKPFVGHFASAPLLPQKLE